jgi:hypothetical protein
VPDLIVSYPVPYTCQFASRDRVRAFVSGSAPLDSDPAWASYGASTPEEYAHWSLRSCGVVCVKMAVEGLTGRPSGTVVDWVQAGLRIDGYITELRPDRPDKPVEKGWKHAALAQLAEAHSLRAELVSGLALDDLAAHARADRLVIASVSAELGEESAPLTRSSGHLVLVLGVTLDSTGAVRHVIVHNPSGRSRALQESARIDAARFAQGFSGRGIVVSRRDL